MYNTVCNCFVTIMYAGCPITNLPFSTLYFKQQWTVKCTLAHVLGQSKVIFNKVIDFTPTSYGFHPPPKTRVDNLIGHLSCHPISKVINRKN